jgi:hypothetical protein
MSKTYRIEIEYDNGWEYVIDSRVEDVLAHLGTVNMGVVHKLTVYVVL